MEPRTLTSPHNPVAQRFRRAADGVRGRREGVFLLEGRHLLWEAVRARWPVEILLVDRDLFPRLPRNLAGKLGAVPTYLVPRDLLSRLGTVPSPEGVLALCPRREEEMRDPEPGSLFLYLDRVQDPANVGMLVRSAMAFGASGVLCGPGTADPFGPTALARSAGAALHMNPARVEHRQFSDWAGRNGMRVLSTETSAPPPTPPSPRGPPVALVLGNEGRGISDSLRGIATGAVGLPMAPGWDSLNVAVAGSILLYLLAPQPPAGSRPGGVSGPPLSP